MTGMWSSRAVGQRPMTGAWSSHDDVAGRVAGHQRFARGRLDRLGPESPGRGSGLEPDAHGRQSRLAGRGGAVVARGRRAGTRGTVTRRRPPRTGGDVELAVVLDLLAAAAAGGAGLPRVLDATGTAVGGRLGAALVGAGRALLLGATWDDAWTSGPASRAPGVDRVRRALRPAWESGVPIGRLLRTAAEDCRRERTARAMTAAARLGTRLVLPLGLCHLPAFVLVGVVPVLASMAGDALV